MIQIGNGHVVSGAQSRGLQHEHAVCSQSCVVHANAVFGASARVDS